MQPFGVLIHIAADDIDVIRQTVETQDGLFVISATLLDKRQFVFLERQQPPRHLVAIEKDHIIFIMI